MLNRVVLMGRICHDLELKKTPSDISVTSFRIAVERSYVKQGEERKADFIDIVCWRNTADFVCKFFKKGSLIAVEGQLQSRTYQATDGTNRYAVEVVADNVSFPGEKREQGNAQPAPTVTPSPAPVVAEPKAEYTQDPFTSATVYDEVYGDDLPF